VSPPRAAVPERSRSGGRGALERVCAERAENCARLLGRLWVAARAGEAEQAEAALEDERIVDPPASGLGVEASGLLAVA
jgi:hypothetical protein